MSINAMIVGALQDAYVRDEARGDYVLATLRVTNQNVTPYWKVFSSDKPLSAKLLSLEVGNVVAFSGPTRFELWHPTTARLVSILRLRPIKSLRSRQNKSPQKNKKSRNQLCGTLCFDRCHMCQNYQSHGLQVHPISKQLSSLTDKGQPENETSNTSTLSKTKKPKGGWRSLKGLRYGEVQNVLSVRKKAQEAGTPFNFFVSIKPHKRSFSSDAQCKRYLAMRAKNLIQAVRGYGKVLRQTSVPAITIYEKEADGGLHCHMLIYVQRGNDAIQRVSDGVEVHCKSAHANSANYMLKTRLPVGDPEAEKSFVRATGLIRKGRQSAIRGVRMSLNSDAKKLLAGQ